MSLQSKVSEINTQLKEDKLNAYVKAARFGLPFNRKEGIQVIVSDVQALCDIDVSAQVQKILRKSLGYGTAKVEYTKDLKKLVLEYIPIPTQNVASTKADYIESYSKSYSPSSTPGCTPLGK